jgi:hypothetical protein
MGYRYYAEANHLFIKTFVSQVAEDFGPRLRVIHLVRQPLAVASSIYRLQDYPGTEVGNRWWLDYRAPTNQLPMAQILDQDSEFSHPFYKGLWYWFEVEARIQVWRRRLPHVPFYRFETDWLNDPARVQMLLGELELPADPQRMLEYIGTKENERDCHKRGPELSVDEMHGKLELFRGLLESRGHRAQVS